MAKDKPLESLCNRRQKEALAINLYNKSHRLYKTEKKKREEKMNIYMQEGVYL